MHSLLSATIMADFGMALPYFIEIVELKNTTILYGPRVAHSMIGQVFGEQAIIMTGIAPDGQTWRAIYPHDERLLGHAFADPAANASALINANTSCAVTGI